MDESFEKRITAFETKIASLDQQVADLEARNAALVKSEQRYRSLLENNLFGYAYCQMLFENGQAQDFIFLDVNQTFEYLTDLKGVVGRKFGELIPGIHQTNLEVIVTCGRVASTGNSEKFETYFESLQLWLSVAVHSPEPGYFIAQFERINERKQAEESLRFTQFIVDHSADASIWLTKEAGRVTYVNEAACRMLGYERGELLSLTAFEIDPNVPPQGWNENFEILKKQGSITFQSSQKAKDGRLIPVEVTANYVEFGGQVYNCALIRDITERKRAEAALQQKTEELDRYFNLNLDLMVIADTDGYFRKLNPVWERTLGYRLDELLEKRFLDFIHPEDLESTLAAVSTLASQKEVLDFVNRYRCQDGTYRWIEWCSAPLGNLIYAAARDITERKQMEAALKESEFHYRALADSGQALIWTAGIDKKCDYFNQPWLSFTGRTLEQELGDGWVEGVHPEDVQRCLEIYVNAFDRREKFSMDYRLRHVSGEYHWIQDDGTPRYNSKAEFIGYIGHCLDITERKRAEEALLIIQDETQAILTALPDLMFEVDQAGRFYNYHAASHETLYVPPEAFFGKTVEEVLPASASKVVLEALVQANLHGWHRGAIYALDFPTGSRWFELSIETKNGRLAPAKRFIAIARDITERKRIEEALQQSEKQYRAILESSPIPYALNDDDQNITLLNSAFVQTFGYTLEDIPTLTDWWSQAYPDPEYRQWVASTWQARLERARRDGAGFEPLEVSLRCKNGKTRIVLASANALMDSFSKVHLVVLYDITERKQAEDKVRAALTEKEMLLRELNHRTKNNLSIVSSLVELQAEASENEQFRALALTLEGRLRSISLVHEMLYRSPSFSQVDLEAYTRELVENLKSAFLLAPERVEVELDAMPVLVGINSAIPCGQILNELISNAFKYAFPNQRQGRVTIQIHQAPEGEITLRVADNGVGFPAEYDAITSRSLGMTILQMLVRQLHGRLELQKTNGVTCEVHFRE